ncbi:hypothetical protein IP69_00855 [Bosea sp. AAP35]|nr:hypothetical protein IP69_00855 [Bosea sp. AAP35]
MAYAAPTSILEREWSDDLLHPNKVGIRSCALHQAGRLANRCDEFFQICLDFLVSLECGETPDFSTNHFRQFNQLLKPAVFGTSAQSRQHLDQFLRAFSDRMACSASSSAKSDPSDHGGDNPQHRPERFGRRHRRHAFADRGQERTP